MALSQAKLREQVEGLVGRMNSRLVEPDPAFQRIAELLPKAAEEMKAAEGKLQAQAPTDALPPENRALQQLQKAEEEYEKQVSQQRGGGGGGGGGAGSVPRISPSCSSRIWTSSPTSTRPRSARSSSRPTSRSTR